MSATAPRLGGALPPSAGMAAALLLHAAPAQAETVSRFSADASAGVGGSTNPFLAEEEERGSIFAELAVVPRYELVDELGRTTLEGRLRTTQYASEFGNSEEYGASVATERRLDPTTTGFVSLTFNSSIPGERGTVVSPSLPPAVPGDGEAPSPIDPLDPTDPIIDPDIDPDVSLTGLRQRRNIVRAIASLSKQLSEQNQLDLGLDIGRSTFPGARLASDFWSYGGTVSFRHALSPLSSLGARASARQTDSDAPDLSSFSYQTEVFFTNQVSPLWSLDGGLGVVIVLPETGGSELALAANVRACGSEPRASFCVAAYSDSAAAALGGVRRRIGASADYSYRPDQYDIVRFTASYTRIGGTIGRSAVAGVERSRDIFRTSASYEKRLSPRLAVGAVAAYRDAFGGDAGGSASADISGQLFLRATLGEVR